MMPSHLPRRRALSTILLLVFFLGGAAEAFAVKPAPAGRRANARKLLRIADGAAQRMIVDGRGRLDRDPNARAFWEALLRMDSEIERIGTGLKSRDLSFFKSLRAGTTTLAELQVTWTLAQAKGVRDASVDQNLRTLAAAHGRLRDRYGPEWVRFQSGRPLNEDEKIRFARMRAEQARLAGKIEVLYDRAEGAGDTATADELAYLLNQIHIVASASPTLGDYLDASVATDALRGAWYGTRAEHAADEEGWADADRVVSEITTDEEVGFVFTTDLDKVEGWSFVEEETDIPTVLADASDEGLAPGRVLDLDEPATTGIREVTEAEILGEGEEGSAEEVDEIQVLETEILDESSAPTEGIEEGIEYGVEEDLPTEPTSADGPIEVEDMEVEDIPVPPASPGEVLDETGACTAEENASCEEGSVPPPVSAPVSSSSPVSSPALPSSAS